LWLKSDVEQTRGKEIAGREFIPRVVRQIVERPPRERSTGIEERSD
jgi:hypothetical protein